MPKVSTLMALAAIAAMMIPLPADAQYFGRNKVQYDRFDFRVLATENYRVHFYPEAAGAAEDAARMAERWYERLARTFGHEIREPRPLILYADHPDFQQTNVLGGRIGEGTGGVTEGIRDRVVMPFGSSYGDTDHVLGHELVHSFQFDIARGAAGGGLGGLMQLPLWFVEGMAEYFSLGPSHSLTGIWMRDALLRNEFPTLQDLTREQQRYFPYRFGHAFFAYVGGRYGDDAISRMLRVATRTSWAGAIREVLVTSPDSLSADWLRAVSEHYGPLLEDRTSPGEAGSLLLSPETGAGRQNVAPSLSPDGRYVAFLSEKDLFTIELFLADARTGEIVRRLTSGTRDAHFDAIRFIDSSGGWSPDGALLAVSVFAQGRNRIDLFRARDGRVERRIEVPAWLGEIRGPVFSPDGRHLAFSGQVGGRTDLFQLEIASGEVTRLTEDRYAALQPVYSPDGERIAFVTDRGPQTDFERLTFGPKSIGILDLSTGRVERVAPFEGAAHWNPQFTPDGADLYFLADPDGFRDIYRVGLASGELYRVSRIATGVSGITDATPALTVARETGTAAFSVFDGGEFHVFALDAVDLSGEPVAVATVAQVDGRLLPGGATAPDAWINRMLGDATAGLPPVGRYLAEAAEPVDRGLGLDYIGQISIGVGADRFGTYVGGAVSAVFSDILGNRQLFTQVQGQGELQDIGGQFFYRDTERRWNWGFGAGMIPSRFFQTQGFRDPNTGETTFVRDDRLTRVTEAVGLLSYPFSTVRRAEFSGGFTRYGFDARRDIFVFDAAGRLVEERREELASPDPLNLGQVSAAFVEDNSFFGFTSPIRGWRARYEVGQIFGSLEFTQLTLDHRRYFAPHQNLTLAVRGLHLGRYGSDVRAVRESRIQPLFLGQEALVRGYSNVSFQVQECTITDQGQCAEFERLLGQQLGVVNLEARVPLFGTDRLGLISFPAFPTELVLFADAGAAWSRDEPVDWSFERRTPARVPVFSTGVSARTNLLGAFIVEVFYAHPFQRPERGAHFGFQIQPGW